MARHNGPWLQLCSEVWWASHFTFWFPYWMQKQREAIMSRCDHTRSLTIPKTMQCIWLRLFSLFLLYIIFVVPHMCTIQMPSDLQVQISFLISQLCFMEDWSPIHCLLSSQFQPTYISFKYLYILHSFPRKQLPNRMKASWHTDITLDENSICIHWAGSNFNQMCQWKYWFPLSVNTKIIIRDIV